MATYIITSTGNPIRADEAFMEANHPGDYALIAETPAATPTLGTVVTPRAFFKRLGATNTAWLYTQAQSNITLEMFKDQAWAGPVDLAAPDTIADLDYLSTLAGSPFTAAVVATVLTAPVQPIEAPS